MCWVAIPYIISALVAVGTAVAADDQQRKATHAQEDQIKEQKKAAEEQRRLDEEILAEQRKQSDAQAKQATSERVLQADVQLGRLRAVAGESGLQGASQDKIISEASGTAYTDLATIESNRNATNRQNDLDGKGANLRAKNATTGLRASNQQNRVAGGLTAAGGVYGAYSGYSSSSALAASRPSSTNIAT